ncbi:T-cell-specific surface glycoprotein CD28-like [Acipenser oxyrinchus oxyrinchus]|uniref:T-cell-specific surface glycoprotein CD28-like n=1 Tax=Acipenser oxyrinchus oxyrinchus TaxID=40147 RepID=A0AAD8LLP8_ACIOX|nr:T-cell-specific surface glycoprotein CD28-like [Acipenser oxyrinchus oxyrinchus]
MFTSATLMFISGCIINSQIVTGGSEITVKQYPQEIRSSHGASVAITCEFNYQGKVPFQTDVSWFRSHNRTINHFSKNEKISTTDNLHIYVYGNHSKCFTILVIQDLQLNDTDKYFCEVLLIVPPPITSRGNGTRLIVYDPEECQTQKCPWLKYFFVALIACGGVVVAVLLMICAKHCWDTVRNKMTRTCHPTDEKNTVYEDMTLVKSSQKGINLPTRKHAAD